MSPQKIEKSITAMEESGGTGACESDEGMLPMWVGVLRDRGYEVDVRWERNTWGVLTRVVGERDGLRYEVTYTPPLPPWVNIITPGDQTLWLVGVVDTNRRSVILLVRKVRPHWLLREALACARGTVPLLEGVDDGTYVRTLNYLGLAGVGVSSRSSEKDPGGNLVR